jgi:peroxiredoxin Q/BCP
MNVGEQVPDFKATLDSGEVTSLAAIVGDGPAVFFFYPKAFTSGCTAQACHFRDLASEFSEAGASRYGISRDDVETQRRFSQEHAFDYPLIADVSGDIAKAFGAKRPGNLWSKRRSYVVGPERRLLGEIKSETDMDAHADEALAILRNA